MSEPGVTLTRLVAVERNAVAGIQTAKAAHETASDAMQRLMKAEAEVAALKNTLTALRSELALIKYQASGAGGPTS
jgi:hypothetical protein